jgi:hypothetical protein
VESVSSYYTDLLRRTVHKTLSIWELSSNSNYKSIKVTIKFQARARYAHFTKLYGTVEVQLHSFLIPVLDGVHGQHHAPAALTLGKELPLLIE